MIVHYRTSACGRNIDPVSRDRATVAIRQAYPISSLLWSHVLCHRSIPLIYRDWQRSIAAAGSVPASAKVAPSVNANPTWITDLSDVLGLRVIDSSLFTFRPSPSRDYSAPCQRLFANNTARDNRYEFVISPQSGIRQLHSEQDLHSPHRATTFLPCLAFNCTARLSLRAGGAESADTPTAACPRARPSPSSPSCTTMPSSLL